MFSTFLDWLCKKIFNEDSLNTLLTNHINSHYPKNNGDVERLEREFVEMLIKGKLL